MWASTDRFLAHSTGLWAMGAVTWDKQGPSQLLELWMLPVFDYRPALQLNNTFSLGIDKPRLGFQELFIEP